jgi:peptidoglycan/xylan/chitin deacetylase (PgdA/CDA1 family)
VHAVDTNKKVVFLTIDDGLDPDPALLTYLKDNNIPVTVFLTTGTTSDWQYWKDIAPVASIQNHSIKHPSLPSLGQAGAQQEICGANEAIEANTGTTPWMMRPPYGAYDSSTLAAAGECGLDYAVHWSVSLPGKSLEYQMAGGSLQPGDIILTHFRKDLASVLPKVIEDIQQQGFELGRLEDYLTPRGWPKPNSEATAEVEMETATESRAYPVQ